MDAGYDQLKNYEAAHKNSAQAIIPLNLRNEKEPPAGMTSNGTPVCSMGYEMVYNAGSGWNPGLSRVLWIRSLMVVRDCTNILRFSREIPELAITS